MDNKKLLTIFTPTYNRKYTLKRLYKSLCNQSSKNFTWLIIDDGSNDDTKELVSKWTKEEIIEIKYFCQSNQGKSQAHNFALDNTNTNFFTCVDSDDFLTMKAVETIEEATKNLKTSNTGILALRKSLKYPITKLKNTKISETTLIDAYNKYGLKGDTFLIYRTDIISKFRFPSFRGEKFVPEKYLYDKIDQLGKLFILKKYLYICEYMDDGYTKNSRKLTLNNPKGVLVYTDQSLQLDKSIKNQFIKSIQHIAYSKIAYDKYDFKYSIKTRILSLPGIVLYNVKYKNYFYSKLV